MRRKMICTALSALLAAPAIAADGPMAFEPIDGETDVLSSEWKIPAGYSQRVISDESDLDIYPGIPDWNDMNVVNESRTGKHPGRFLYRTHEVRPNADDLDAYAGGALSVVDLKTGKARVVVQRKDWEALDGLVWTPWGTLLMAEETGTALLPDPEAPDAVHGMLYEVELKRKNPRKAKSVKLRPALGSLAHEGIEVDGDGNVYVIDEYHSGSIYKFEPDSYGDLSSGQLYVLVVDDSLSGNGTGPAEWVALDRDEAQVSARDAGAAAGGTTYGRPEDLERIGNTLYVANTSEHRVLAITLGEYPVVSEFVNAAIADTDSATFRKVDNLANGPDGRLWIVEDNKPSDIWVADPDSDLDGQSDQVRLFASFNDGSAEGTGIYFGNDPHTLLVNIQHSADGNDRTIAISRDLEDDHEDDDDDDEHRRRRHHD